MFGLIKLLIVFALIIVLIWRKWELGYIMLIASFLLGVLFGQNVIDILKSFIQATIDLTTLELLGIIVLIYLLSNTLDRTESLKHMVDSLGGLIRDNRIVLVIPPVLMGLLPMPGGAMFSAPMVEKVGSKMGLSGEEKTFINFWFRHIWEYTFPLYPGIILLAAILEVPIQKISLSQAPLTLAAIFAGIVFGLMRLARVEQNFVAKKDYPYNLRKLFLNIWPILAIIVAVLFFKLRIIIALLGAVIVWIGINRLKFWVIAEEIKKSLPINALILIVSIMIFKRMLEVTGAISVLPETFASFGISPIIIVFFIPFFIGLLTGVTVAFVGVAYPILLPFIVNGSPNLHYSAFAFAAGFAGVLLSPVHLCLVLTRDYWKADFGQVYKYMALPTAFVVLIGALLLLIK